MAVCCICGKEKDDHLVVMGKCICSDCEWTIVTTKVHEEGYKHCAGQLRKLFDSFSTSGVPEPESAK